MKELSREEKIAKFNDYFIYKFERNVAARYLNAIRTNNTPLINWFESFGDSLHKIISNVRTYERNVELGFPDEKVYNEYGWIVEGKLKPGKVIQIDERNNVFVSVSPNGTWCKGSNLSTNNSGSYTGGSIWDKQFATEREALIQGIEEVIRWYNSQLKQWEHSTDEFDEESGKTIKYNSMATYCKKMIKLAEKELQQLKTPQLELF